MKTINIYVLGILSLDSLSLAWVAGAYYYYYYFLQAAREEHLRPARGALASSKLLPSPLKKNWHTQAALR